MKRYVRRLLAVALLAIGANIYVNYRGISFDVEVSRTLALRQFENDDAVPSMVRDMQFIRNCEVIGAYGVAAGITLFLFRREIGLV